MNRRQREVLMQRSGEVSNHKSDGPLAGRGGHEASGSFNETRSRDWSCPEGDEVPIADT